MRSGLVTSDFETCIEVDASGATATAQKNVARGHTRAVRATVVRAAEGVMFVLVIARVSSPEQYNQARCSHSIHRIRHTCRKGGVVVTSDDRVWIVTSLSKNHAKNALVYGLAR
jgi:hypothetical protein